MLFTSNIHIYFSVNVHAFVLYTLIHTLYYILTVDTYMTAVCINVYMINVHIMALDFDGYARIATLNTDRLWIDYA